MKEKSSDSSHLGNLDSDSNSDVEILDLYHFEFNKPIYMKRIIKLSIKMRFSNAAQFKKMLRLFSIYEGFDFVYTKKKISYITTIASMVMNEGFMLH